MAAPIYQQGGKQNGRGQMNRWTYIISAAAFGLSGAGLSPGALIWPGPVAYALQADDDVDDEIDDDVESDIEESIEDDIEEGVEDDIEEGVEGDIEEGVEGDIEEGVEDDIEEGVEDDIEEGVEDDIEEGVEDDIEEGVEDDIEEGVEDDIEEGVEDDIEEGVEDDIEEGVEDDIEEGVEDDIEEGVEDDIEEGVEDDIEEGVEDVAEEGLNTEESIAAFVEAEFEIEFDDEQREYRGGEHIVMIDADNVSTLVERGYRVLETEKLQGLDIVLVRIETPGEFDIEEEDAALKANDPTAEIDLNHLYETESSSAGSVAPSFYTKPAGEASKQRRSQRAQIGLIDTAIASNHPALKDQRIIAGDFAPETGARPLAHGTAVASILVGRDGAYAGVMPGADLYAASVFVEHSSGKLVATAASLVRALDWMVLNRVPVVNMSLSGPPNDVLEAAIEAAIERNVTVVAAAGNKGPAAEPLYPAGYNSVIAVTAVDRDNRVYRLAGRGDHIDFAAPGARIIAAAPEGGYVSRTGTSFAAPFAAAAISQRCNKRNACADRTLLMKTLIASAVDLGAPGFDAVYGHGLITP